MKAIQTFYNFDKSNNPIKNSAGFLCPEFNWMSMALSCLLLKKHFGSVTLYCNYSVKEVIIDKLKIPYDNVVLIPEFMDKYDNCNLWALPKIYTYSQQQEPFIHVDCDWFMFDKISDKILSSELWGQNIEYDDQLYNKRTIDNLLNNGAIFPELIIDEINKEPILRVVNAGIIGGNDMSFFKEYLAMINTFLESNIEVLRKLNDGFVNSIYEQFFFYVLCKHHNKKIRYCTEGDKLSTRFDWLPADFSYTAKHGYMHLLASLKRNFNAYLFVSHYLEHINPELHKNILMECRNAGIVPKINYFNITPEIFTSQNIESVQNEFKRTINFCLMNNIPIPNKIDSEYILWKFIEDLKFSQSTSFAERVSTMYGFERKKYVTKRLLNIFKFKIFQHQKIMRDFLWDATFSIEDASIKISKYVTLQIVDNQLLKSFVWGKEELYSKLKKEPQIAIAIVPDSVSMKVNEAILYGSNLKIFNLVKKRNSMRIRDLVDTIILDDFSELDISGQRFIRKRLVEYIHTSVKRNLFDIFHTN